MEIKTLTTDEEATLKSTMESMKEWLTISDTDWEINGIMFQCPECHSLVAWPSPFCPLCGKERRNAKKN